MLNRRTLLPLLLLVVAGALLASCNTSSGIPIVTTVAFHADDSGCSPRNISTAQGNLMKLSLTNTASATATFNFPTAPYSFTAEPGKTELGNLTAPTAPGKYPFTCGTATNPSQGEIEVNAN